MGLLPVVEARERILAHVKPRPMELVPLKQAVGRVLAKALSAKRDQPPFAASAMDGYAIHHDDLSHDLHKAPLILKLVGTSAAGHGYKKQLHQGETVRILTGAPLPKGSAAVVIQENVEKLPQELIRIKVPAQLHQHVRHQAIDFKKSENLFGPSEIIKVRDIALLAAMGLSAVPVRQKPVVAIVVSGDELVPVGERPGPHQIYSSNGPALQALAQQFGAEVIDAGIVPDNLKATERILRKLERADIVVTCGGASVGDHDFMQQALKNIGVKIDFWKIAMRPGKPLMFGRKGHQRIMGLPGNPVAALLCGRLFLVPLIQAFLGLRPDIPLLKAQIAQALPANDQRLDHIRALLTIADDGRISATPHGLQDSSFQRRFRQAQGLIIREPYAPACAAGEEVSVFKLDF